MIQISLKPSICFPHRWLPCLNMTWYAFHLRKRDRKSGGALCVSCRVGCLLLCLCSITFPIAGSSLWAWSSSLGVTGCTCSVTLLSIMRFTPLDLLDRGASRTASPWHWAFIASSVALTQLGSTSSLHSLMGCSTGILDTASASLLAESSATQRWPVALILTEVSWVHKLSPLRCFFQQPRAQWSPLPQIWQWSHDSPLLLVLISWWCTGQSLVFVSIRLYFRTDRL